MRTRKLQKAKITDVEKKFAEAIRLHKKRHLEYFNSFYKGINVNKDLLYAYMLNDTGRYPTVGSVIAFTSKEDYVKNKEIGQSPQQVAYRQQMMFIEEEDDTLKDDGRKSFNSGETTRLQGSTVFRYMAVVEELVFNENTRKMQVKFEDCDGNMQLLDDSCTVVDLYLYPFSMLENTYDRNFNLTTDQFAIPHSIFETPGNEADEIYDSVMLDGFMAFERQCLELTDHQLNIIQKYFKNCEDDLTVKLEDIEDAVEKAEPAFESITDDDDEDEQEDVNDTIERILTTEILEKQLRVEASSLFYNYDVNNLSKATARMDALIATTKLISMGWIIDIVDEDFDEGEDEWCKFFELLQDSNIAYSTLNMYVSYKYFITDKAVSMAPFNWEDTFNCITGKDLRISASTGYFSQGGKEANMLLFQVTEENFNKLVADGDLDRIFEGAPTDFDTLHKIQRLYFEAKSGKTVQINDILQAAIQEAGLMKFFLEL